MKPKIQNRKKNNKNVNVLYFDKNETKTINKGKIAGIIILILLIVLLIILYAVYANNESFRTYMDTNVLKKAVEEDNLKTIALEDYDNSNIFAYYKYIAILKDNNLTTYNSSGKKESENKVEISNPITYTNGKYFMIAEQNSSRVYLISDNTIKWQKDLEGNITRININENGYCSVVLAGTANKSVVILFDNSGNEIFRYYLARTFAVDTSISDDNKYLSIAEVNTSGTLIQSNIKIISVEKAKEEPSQAILYTYNAPSNSLILNIKYHNKTKLVCEYDDAIRVIEENDQESKITDINTKLEKITFSSIELNGHVVKNIEENSGILNTTTTVKIINSTSQKENVYKFEGVAKEFYCKDNKIAINLGSEIHFIDTNGWLIKKYASSKEIRKIVISDYIAGIVYRNKIEIVKF